MRFFGEIIRYGRLWDRIRRLERCTPEHLQRTLLHLGQHFAQSLQTGDRDILVEAGDHAGGSVRNDRFCIAGNAELAAFAVDMAIDQAGNQIASRRIDDLGVRPDVIGHVADCCDHVAIDGNISRIDLTGHDIDKLSAANHLICGDQAAAGADAGFQSADCVFHNVFPPVVLDGCSSKSGVPGPFVPPNTCQ